MAIIIKLYFYVQEEKRTKALLTSYDNDLNDSSKYGLVNGHTAVFAVLTIVFALSIINGIKSIDSKTVPTSQYSVINGPANPESSIIGIYNTYTNPRFGYSIHIPKGFIAEPDPDNGDGRTYHSQDGKCKISVWGFSGEVFELTLGFLELTTPITSIN